MTLAQTQKKITKVKLFEVQEDEDIQVLNAMKGKKNARTGLASKKADGWSF